MIDSWRIIIQKKTFHNRILQQVRIEIFFCRREENAWFIERFRWLISLTRSSTFHQFITQQNKIIFTRKNIEKKTEFPFRILIRNERKAFRANSLCFDLFSSKERDVSWLEHGSRYWTASFSTNSYCSWCGVFRCFSST